MYGTKEPIDIEGKQHQRKNNSCKIPIQMKETKKRWHMEEEKRRPYRQSHYGIAFNSMN